MCSCHGHLSKTPLTCASRCASKRFGLFSFSKDRHARLIYCCLHKRIAWTSHWAGECTASILEFLCIMSTRTGFLHKKKHTHTGSTLVAAPTSDTCAWEKHAKSIALYTCASTVRFFMRRHACQLLPPLSFILSLVLHEDMSPLTRLHLPVLFHLSMHFPFEEGGQRGRRTTWAHPWCRWGCSIWVSFGSYFSPIFCPMPKHCEGVVVYVKPLTAAFVVRRRLSSVPHPRTISRGAQDPDAEMAESPPIARA